VVLHHKNGMIHLEKKMNRNTNNFQKIAVKKKPIKKYNKDWKITRKLQRKSKRVMQDKVYA